MKSLANWLYDNGRDYNLGVELFEQLKVDPKKNLFFKVRKPDSIRISMLRNMLTNYARIHRIKPEPAVIPHHNQATAAQARQAAQGKQAAQMAKPASNRPTIDKNPHVNYDELPDELKTIYDQSAGLSRELKSYHTKLKIIAEDSTQASERAELCQLIVRTDGIIRANYAVIDEWYLSGKKTQPKIPDDGPVMTDLEKDRRIKANLNYIRRYHNDPAKQAEVKIRMTELDKWEISYERLLTSAAD